MLNIIYSHLPMSDVGTIFLKYADGKMHKIEVLSNNRCRHETLGVDGYLIAIDTVHVLGHNHIMVQDLEYNMSHLIVKHNPKIVVLLVCTHAEYAAFMDCIGSEVIEKYMFVRSHTEPDLVIYLVGPNLQRVYDVPRAGKSAISKKICIYTKTSAPLTQTIRDHIRLACGYNVFEFPRSQKDVLTLLAQ